LVPAEFRSTAKLSECGDFDVVADAASGADSAPLDLALRAVRDGGTVVVQNAYYVGVTLQTPLRDIFRRSIRLIGSFSHCRREPEDFAVALDLLSLHSMQMAGLAANIGELSDLSAALRGHVSSAVRPVLAVRA
jgi:threonine dehydrogenase-like Zn-dependent dehydrogenase